MQDTTSFHASGPHASIAVLGGGIGGLATAIALRQKGFERVTLYEQARSLRPVGAGISLWNNALDALERLGVGDALDGLGWAVTTSALRTSDGRPLSNSLSEPFVSRLRRPELLRTVLRSDLQDLLLQRLHQLHPGGDDPLILGARCTTFETVGGRVRLTFEDGTRQTADLLIGADGVNSVVRRQLHPGAERRYAGYSAWRAVVDVPAERCEPGEAWGPGTRFGQLPVSRKQVYWFATGNEPEGAHAPHGEREQLLRRFASWSESTRRLIAAATEDRILRNDVYESPPLAHWGRGPVTLLGDAAHPMSPNLGQGGCQALEDAVVLAHCLARIDDPVDALRRYEEVRRRRTRRFVNQSRSIGRIGQLESPVACALRNLVVRAMPARLQENQLAQLLTFDL